MKRLFRRLCVMLALFSVTPASAVDVIYSASGNANGTLNGIGFSGPMQITSFGNLSTRQPCTTNGVIVAGCQFILNDELLIGSASIGLVRVVAPTISFFNDGPNVFGFSVLGLSPQQPVYTFAFVNVLNFSPDFASWDGISDFNSATNWSTGGPPNAFVPTDAGQLQFTNGPIQSASFSALNIAGGVPEPATWAMMIFGFALVGGAMRRRAHTPTLLPA